MPTLKGEPLLWALLGEKPEQDIEIDRLDQVVIKPGFPRVRRAGIGVEVRDGDEDCRWQAGLAAGLAQERFERKPRGPLDGRIDVNMMKFGVEASDDVRHALNERPELAILSLQRGAVLLELFPQLEPLYRILERARQARRPSATTWRYSRGRRPEALLSPPCTPPRSQ